MAFIQKCKTLLHQLPPAIAWRHMLMQAAVNLFDSSLISSYSQTGEDRVIDYYLADVYKGYYVDVGCNQPVRWSNTFNLYKRGWNGLNIDANERMIRKFDAMRPRDINICSAVSNAAKEVTFTEFGAAAASTIKETFAPWTEKTGIVSQKKMQAQTLQSICERYKVPSCFELLSIDVEGCELEVLSSISFDHYRPRLIVVEIHRLDLNNAGNHEICKLLNNHDYILAGYCTCNAYFVDRKFVQQNSSC